MEEELPTLRLKGYLEVMIVGMRYNYKSSDGECLPNPAPGCPVSLQPEPSNLWDQNAIKVINEVNKRHLGYFVKETSKYLGPFLKDNIFATARGVLSVPRDPRCGPFVISCHVLLFCAEPPRHVPPLPPQLDLHEDLSSSYFTLVDTPVAFMGCILDDYDSYIARCLPRLQLPCQVEQPLSHPSSSNAGPDTFVRMQKFSGLEPLPPEQVQLPQNTDGKDDEAAISDHIIRGSDGTVESQTIMGRDPLPTQKVQLPQNTDGANIEAAISDHIDGSDETVESHNSVRVVDQTKKRTDHSPRTKPQTPILAAERNESVCVKCKQMGGGPFFQCAQSGCPVIIHERCMSAVVDGRCIFCIFLARRGETLKVEKGSSSYKELKSKYWIARTFSIQYFGKKTFIRLRKLAGLDPILPTTVQVPCTVSMQCSTEGGEDEAVATGTTRVKVAAKENKEKGKDAAKSSREENLEETEQVGHGKKRLPHRPSLLRSCKQRCQLTDNLGRS